MTNNGAFNPHPPPQKSIPLENKPTIIFQTLKPPEKSPIFLSKPNVNLIPQEIIRLHIYPQLLLPRTPIEV